MISTRKNVVSREKNAVSREKRVKKHKNHDFRGVLRVSTKNRGFTRKNRDFTRKTAISREKRVENAIIFLVVVCCLKGFGACAEPG